MHNNSRLQRNGVTFIGQSLLKLYFNKFSLFRMRDYLPIWIFAFFSHLLVDCSKCLSSTYSCGTLPDRLCQTSWSTVGMRELTRLSNRLFRITRRPNFVRVVCPRYFRYFSIYKLIVPLVCACNRSFVYSFHAALALQIWR